MGVAKTVTEPQENLMEEALSQVSSANLPTKMEISLVSRPSHCSLFDCLQYAKTEGESLVYFI